MRVNWQEIEGHAGRQHLHIDSSHGKRWRAALEIKIQGKRQWW